MNTIKPPIVNVPLRLGSMILDHFIMTMITMVFFIPLMIGAFENAFNITHEQTDMNFDGPLLYVAILGFALYFCKDSINGRSIGKRLTKTQVINENTGMVASPLRCFVRNLFIVIWPIEVIVTLISPNRRIGDRVAGTSIVAYDPINRTQPKFEIGKALAALTISYGILFLGMMKIQKLIPVSSKINYIETSYNDTESKALEKLFADSLGQTLTASVRVYDKIQQQDLKYISIIITMKDGHIPADDKIGETSDHIMAQTERLLYSKYPKETFAGQSKYVFKASGSILSINNPIGININHNPRQDDKMSLKH